MKRWKSPQVAAKLAERAAKEAEKNRKEKRNARFMIIGWAIVTISLIVGDYFWLKARAQKRREQHMQTRHRTAQTNDAMRVPITDGTNVSHIP